MILRQTTGLVPDTQNPAVGAMAAQTLPAAVTCTAPKVDLAHYPPPHPLRRGGRDHLADKFMPQNAADRHIPGNVNIRLANPGQTDPDQGLPGPRLGGRDLQ